jgi:hypothetical protein
MRMTLLLLICVACVSHGPSTVSRDRDGYSSAIGRSLNHELLLNIVRLRYLDMPVFLDVQQILAGYTLEGTAGAGWSEKGLAGGWNFGAGGKYIDRPTITYRPRAGAVFAKNIMTPLEPRAILYLIQSGYAADFVFPLCVESMNGLRNGSSTLTGTKKTDPRFDRVVQLMSKVQRGSGLGMRIEKNPEDERGAVLIVVGRRDAAADVQAASVEVGELLGLESGAHEYSVLYGSGAGDKTTLTMQTRSVLHIMFELSNRITAPPEHVKKGYVVPASNPGMVNPLIAIESSESEPSDAFVKVRYHDNWFWINHNDLRSKRTFTFLHLLSAFVESAQPQLPTLLTVPG